MNIFASFVRAASIVLIALLFCDASNAIASPQLKCSFIIDEPQSPPYNKERYSFKFPDGSPIPLNYANGNWSYECVGDNFFYKMEGSERSRFYVLNAKTKKSELITEVVNMALPEFSVSPDEKTIVYSSIVGLYLYHRKSKRFELVVPRIKKFSNMDKEELAKFETRFFHLVRKDSAAIADEDQPYLLGWDVDSQRLWFGSNSMEGWSELCYLTVADKVSRCFKAPFNDANVYSINPEGTLAVYQESRLNNSDKPKSRTPARIRIIDLKSRKIITLFDGFWDDKLWMQWKKDGGIDLKITRKKKLIADKTISGSSVQDSLAKSKEVWSKKDHGTENILFWRDMDTSEDELKLLPGREYKLK